MMKVIILYIIFQLLSITYVYSQDFEYPINEKLYNSKLWLKSNNFEGTVHLLNGEKKYGIITYYNDIDMLTVENDSTYSYHLSSVSHFYHYQYIDIVNFNYFIVLKNKRNNYDCFLLIERGKISLFIDELNAPYNIENEKGLDSKIIHKYYYYYKGKIKYIKDYKKQIYPLMKDKKTEIDKYNGLHVREIAVRHRPQVPALFSLPSSSGHPCRCPRCREEGPWSESLPFH